MTIKELMDVLSTFDPQTEVLCEFDSDGDGFMIKTDVKHVYEGSNVDDVNWDDDGNQYCVIQLNY
jgi:hypothetical protein